GRPSSVRVVVGVELAAADRGAAVVSIAGGEAEREAARVCRGKIQGDVVIGTGKKRATGSSDDSIIVADHGTADSERRGRPAGVAYDAVAACTSKSADLLAE